MIMKEYNKIMLISPSEIKATENVNYNTSDETIGYSIRTAQDTYLQEIIGTALYDKIRLLVFNSINHIEDNIDDAENAEYAILLDDYISPYLASKTMVELLMPISYKVRNVGVSKNSDININSASDNELKYLLNMYEVRVANYATKLSQYLCRNKELFPELDDCPSCGQKALIGYKFQPTRLYLGKGKKGCCNG